MFTSTLIAMARIDVARAVIPTTGPVRRCQTYAHRLHLYGDIYSSPGITLRQKQLLMAAFLGEANMHDQLFGHLIAVRLPDNQSVITPFEINEITG